MARCCHSAAMAAACTGVSRWQMAWRDWKRFLVDPWPSPQTAVGARDCARIPRQSVKLKCRPTLNLAHGVAARANLTSIPVTPVPPYLPSRAQRDNLSLEPALQVRWESRRPWGPLFGDLRYARTSCLYPLFLPSHGIVPTRGEGHTAAQPYDGGLASRRHTVASCPNEACGVRGTHHPRPILPATINNATPCRPSKQVPFTSMVAI
jgi:hypothetical protein